MILCLALPQLSVVLVSRLLTHAEVTTRDVDAFVRTSGLMARETTATCDEWAPATSPPPPSLSKLPRPTCFDRISV